MSDLLRRTGVLSALLLVSLCEWRAADAPINVTFSFTYYRCAQPATVSCKAYREQDIDACKQCREWQSEMVVRSFQTTLADIYVDTQRPAKQFIQDILTSVYDLSPEEVEHLTPANIAALYDDPQRYGWVELSEPRAGAIVIDRFKAVFVISNPQPQSARRRPPRTFRTFFSNPLRALRILYPSAKHNNELTPSVAWNVFRGRRTKSLVPAKLTDTTNLRGTQTRPIGWNAWVDEAEHPYKSLQSIEPHKAYEIALALAPFEFKDQYGHLARRDLRERITSDIRLHRMPDDLTAILTVDESMLDVLDGTRKSTKIDMERMSAWYPDGVPPQGDPLEYLARGGDPAFVFAEPRFTIAGKRDGLTLATISIWQRGWPVDEISIPICVSQRPERVSDVCRGKAPLKIGFGSAGFARREGSQPTAAIDMSFDQKLITATFHRNDEEDAPYYSWRLPITPAEFTQQLARLTEKFAAAQTNDAFALAGEQLYKIIFAGTDPANTRAADARFAFAEFVKKYMATPPPDGRHAPVLYIRCIEDEPARRVFLVPFGMMKIPEVADSFVGFWFNTESALPRHVSMQEQPCVSRWCLVIPPHTREFEELRGEFDKEVPAWPVRAHTYSGLADFTEWIRKEEKDPATAVVILSHYGLKNGVSRLVMGDDDLSSVDIGREFTQSSIAILNGCGSAQPGAEDFVNVLNMHGVDTIVATRYEVSTELAVEYFAALASNLSLTEEGAGSLAAANFDAVRRLRTKRPALDQPPFGPAALAYTILGEPSLSLCQPDPARDPDHVRASK